MKKTLCMLMALVITFGLMGAAATAEAAYSPGTYSSTAPGFGGDVTVTITVDENAITDVTIEGPNETEGVGAVAVANMPAAILKSGADVDMVSGATVTSTAIVTATGLFTDSS